jgi:hypothetical protein
MTLPSVMSAMSLRLPPHQGHVSTSISNVRVRSSAQAGPTLRFMDWVGNKHHGVRLPYNYWPEARWRAAWKALGLRVEAFHTRLDLYPGPFRWLFESGLQFVARLGID